MLRRRPSMGQSERAMPMRINEDVRKTTARYGAVERQPADGEDSLAAEIEETAEIEEAARGRKAAAAPVFDEDEAFSGFRDGPDDSVDDDPAYPTEPDPDLGQPAEPRRAGGPALRPTASEGGGRPGQAAYRHRYGTANKASGTGGIPAAGGASEAGRKSTAGRTSAAGRASRAGVGRSVQTAVLLADATVRALEGGGEETQDRRQEAKSTARALRAARRRRRMAQAVGRSGQKAATVVSGVVKRAADTALLKAAAAKVLLPAALILLPILLIALMFFSIFTLKSAPADLNDAYRYVTRLDAALEARLRTAGISGVETVYLVNGFETDAASIQIETDVDGLLLYLDAAYETTELSASIAGAFGSTVQEEIDALHDRMYSYSVLLVAPESAAPEASGPPAGESAAPVASAEPVEHCEVLLTVRSLGAVLQDAGAVSEEMRDLADGTREIGLYAAMETLASPFDGPYYVSGRWGWYTSPAGVLQYRDGVELRPLSSGSGVVYSCLAGTVSSAGGSVTISDGSQAVTYRGISLTVTAGEEIERGAPMGTLPAGQALSLRYEQDGTAVNPVFYLPSPGQTGTAADLVSVAAAQLGNVGGEPYWRWYGFDSHVDWCACFVSWCADQCGCIASGAIPRFAGCTTGSGWFKARGLWQDRGAVPSPGQLIFFDWEDDGVIDHVGIVSEVRNGMVYTIEGNSGDCCRERCYVLGSREIHGYGTPAY